MAVPKTAKGRIGSLVAAAALVVSTITGVHTATTPEHPSCSSSSFVQPVYSGKTSPSRWVDSSYYQRHVDSSYPYAVYAARSNDGGGFRDPAFVSNCRWARSQVKTGKLAAFLAYYVYRPGQNSVALLKAQIGAPFPGLVVMVDVESWGGQIRGNHSSAINNEVHQIAKWLGSAARVVGYGNYYDLASIWPSRSVPVIVADYSGSSDAFVLGRVAGAIGRQYTSSGSVAPFGHPVDVNRSPLSVAKLAKALGVPLRIKPVKPVITPPKPATTAKPKIKISKPVIKGSAKPHTRVHVAVTTTPKATLRYHWLIGGHQVSHKKSPKVNPKFAGKKLTVKVTAKRKGYVSVSKTSKAVKIPVLRKTVKVRPGDSLWSIAHRNHIKVKRLIKLNPSIKPPALIYPGESVRVA